MADPIGPAAGILLQLDVRSPRLTNYIAYDISGSCNAVEPALPCLTSLQPRHCCCRIAYTKVAIDRWAWALFKRTKSVGHLVNWGARLFVRAVNRQITPLGISAGQIPVFLALSETHALSQKDLVQNAAVEQPTMAATLRRMETAGLVSRVSDPKDGRTSLFSLTPSGNRVLTSLYAALEEGNRNALAGFSREERDLILSLLQRIIANLSAR